MRKKPAPVALSVIERLLRAAGAGGVVARFHSLLGLEQRFLRPHALEAGRPYAPDRCEEALGLLDAPGRALKDRAPALALRGRLLRVLNRKEEALESFDLALKLAPADARTRAWRGELMAHMKDGAEDGIAELEAAGRALPGDPWPWIWAAAARLATSAGPETFSALNAALKADRRNVPALLLRAEAFRRAGDQVSALADVSRAIRLEPFCAGAHIMRGDFEAGLENKKAALAALAFASRLDPDIKNRYLDLLPAGNLEGGPVSRLTAYIRRHPRTAWTYALRGDALRGPGLDGDEPGMADLSRAVKLDPKTPWIRACLARSQVQYAYPDEGIKHLKAALAQDPKCAWLNSWMGESYRRVKRPELAVKFFRRAIALDPRFSQAHLWLGRVYCDKGQWARGVAEFTRAIELNCAYGLAYAKRGDALARLKRHAAAITDFNWALNFQVPYGREWIWSLRSRSRMAIGDYAGACDDLALVARKQPRLTWVPLQHGGKHDPRAGREALTALDDALAQYNRAGWLWAWQGAVLLGCGRLEEGLASLERCLELEPLSAWAYGWRGRALWQNGREGAAADLDRALALDAGCPWLWSWRAELLLGRGKNRAALKDADRALELSPLDAHASYCRGEALRRLGKTKEALRSLDVAVEFDPISAPTFISRGVLLGAMGDHKGQLRDFRCAARAAPDLFRRKLAGGKTDVEALLRSLLEAGEPALDGPPQQG